MARWGNSRKSSGRHIAALMNCDGFNPRLAGEIRRWYRSYASPKALAKIDGRKEAWARFSKELTTPQLKAIGDFVNEMMEAGFVSGLRLGLSASLFPSESEDK